jgi:hypothetical protein
MTIRTAQFAIAVALISPIVIATSYPSLAAAGGAQNGGAGCFKKGTRPHTVRRYYNYAPQLHGSDYQALQEVLEK